MLLSYYHQFITKIRKMCLSLASVKYINETFQLSLIDQQFLNAFENNFHYDFLYQIHYIRTMKNQNQKKQFLKVIEQQTNQLLKVLERKPLSFRSIEKSKKVSDYACLIRTILCRNQKALKSFLQIRKDCLKDLKGDKEVPKKLLNAFSVFYDTILQGNCISTQKNQKTILTGILKLFKQQPPKKKSKRDRRKEKDLLKHRRLLYKTNRTIRDILDYCQLLKKSYDNDQEFLLSVSQLLQERKWMGPNLYKVLLQNKWKGYQIDTLIDLMEEARNSQSKFNDEKTQNLIIRTIGNLKTCSAFLKAHPNCVGSFRLIATIENWSNNLLSLNQIENNLLFSNLQYDRQKDTIGRTNSKPFFKFSSQISVEL